jgi:hypothetical protein
LSEIRDLYFSTEEFFALLTGEYINLAWPTVVSGMEQDEIWCIYYFRRGTPSGHKLHRLELWTEFSRLEQSFGSLFTCWRKIRELFGAGAYLHIAAMRNALPYPEHRFVNLIWALETLHRRLGLAGPDTPSAAERKIRVDRVAAILNTHASPEDRDWFASRAGNYRSSPALEDRIFDLLDRLPINWDGSALRNFSRRCADRRNGISHEGGPLGNETYQQFLGDLLALNEALRYLYHALLLNEIGLDSANLQHAMTLSPLAHLRVLPALNNVGLALVAAAKA